MDQIARVAGEVPWPIIELSNSECLQATLFKFTILSKKSACRLKATNSTPADATRKNALARSIVNQVEPVFKSIFEALRAEYGGLEASWQERGGIPMNPKTRQELTTTDLTVYTPEISKFEEKLKLRNLAKSTLNNDISCLKIFLAWCILTLSSKPSDRISYDDFRTFIHFPESGELEPRTINVYIASLKQFRYLVQGEGWNRYEIQFKNMIGLCRSYRVLNRPGQSTRARRHCWRHC